MAAARRLNRAIAVAGKLGSGKTTLVNGLSAQLGWDRCPRQSPDPAYVERIHEDPSRWSFEAQLNFLVLKASGMREGMLIGRDLVIDRSIFEDRDVMARSWGDRYWDDSARRTYAECAANLCLDLPQPDAIVYCRCSDGECDRRRGERPRSYQRLYDPSWVVELNARYDEWVETFDACPLLELDTEANDVRDPRVVAAVIADLRSNLGSEPPDQALLFDPSGNLRPPPLFETDERPELRVLRPLNDVRTPHPSRYGDLGRDGGASAHLDGRPAVYLAAPFTAAAIEPPILDEDLRLPVSIADHGVLPAAYREILEAAVRVLERAGVNVILPHRDVNAWGERVLSPADVASECLGLAAACDGFIGLLGDSFIGRGLAGLDGVERVRVARLSELPDAIERSDMFGALVKDEKLGG
jgi:deoxyadenosine/deoxycytidine kinase